MKRSLVILAMAASLGASPLRVHAADTGPLITTPLLGISIGSMAGFLAGLRTGDPQDHTTYAGIGAGIGFAIGLTLGIRELYKASAGFYLREKGGETLYGFGVLLPFE